MTGNITARLGGVPMMMLMVAAVMMMVMIVAVMMAVMTALARFHLANRNEKAVVGRKEGRWWWWCGGLRGNSVFFSSSPLPPSP